MSIGYKIEFGTTISLLIISSLLWAGTSAIPFYGSPTLALLNALGEAYFKSGQLVKAIEVLSESLKIEPNQPELKSFLEKLKESKIKPF